jgi:chloride channel protein, CIC family
MRKPPSGIDAAVKLADFTTDLRVLLLVAMALVVGTGGAAAAWFLMRLIALVTNLVWFGQISTDSASLAHAQQGPWMVAIPALGGLVIGLMARFGSEKIRGHGIPEAIEAILYGRSRMSAKVAILKPLSSAISIGTGGPFGAEGPIIMTGGAFGSLFAQCFHLSAAERKTLLVAGAAAGMTAIFGTPIAAVLLAVELLLFEWKPRSFIPVAVAAIVAIGWRPYLFGAGPLFPFSSAPSLSAQGLVLCVALGLVFGLQSGLMTTLVYKVEDLFERLPIHWMWWPTIGGICVGLGGLIEPRALGVGYDVIGDLLANHETTDAALKILLVKTAIWVIALSSGTSGGVLAPLLILGGSLGWLIGLALPGDPGFWALVGMSAMMAGTMRAPLTGTMFAVELTGNVHVLVPVFAASIAAYGLTILLLKRSILTERLARRGQHITREYTIDAYELTRVAEIMTRKVETLPADMPAQAAAAFLTEAGDRHRMYPIVDAHGVLAGSVGRADVLRWRQESRFDTLTLFDLVSDASTPVAFPDEIVGRVADRMVSDDLGRMPVVERETRRLVGLIARKDLLRVRSTTAEQEKTRESFYMRGPRFVRARVPARDNG